jgi:hypothetical protein
VILAKLYQTRRWRKPVAICRGDRFKTIGGQTAIKQQTMPGMFKNVRRDIRRQGAKNPC